ncbi:MAG: hypothetical protein ACI90V_006907, partial [Bacillariaceae sp.]
SERQDPGFINNRRGFAQPPIIHDSTRFYEIT